MQAARDVDRQDICLDDIRAFTPRQTGPQGRPWRYGVEFYAESKCGTYATGHRPVGSYPLDSVARAASWTAYGYVIARLFVLDPHAVIGWYDGVGDFITQIKASHRKDDKGFLALVEGTGYFDDGGTWQPWPPRACGSHHAGECVEEYPYNLTPSEVSTMREYNPADCTWEGEGK